jgi:hypothetical protein
LSRKSNKVQEDAHEGVNKDQIKIIKPDVNTASDYKKSQLVSPSYSDRGNFIKYHTKSASQESNIVQTM